MTTPRRCRKAASSFAVLRKGCRLHHRQPPSPQCTCTPSSEMCPTRTPQRCRWSPSGQVSNWDGRLFDHEAEAVHAVGGRRSESDFGDVPMLSTLVSLTRQTVAKAKMQKSEPCVSRCCVFCTRAQLLAICAPALKPEWKSRGVDWKRKCQCGQVDSRLGCCRVLRHACERLQARQDKISSGTPRHA